MLDQPVPNPLAKNPNVYTHKVFAAVGLILIGTIISVAGIWWYVENQSGTSTAEDEVNTTKVSTSSAKKATDSSKKDETADWKTYKGTKYSIKYPNDWQVLENINHVGAGWPNYDHFYKVMVEMEPGVNVIVTTKNTPQAWADKLGSGPDTPTFTDYTVDGVKGSWVDKGTAFQPFVIVDKGENSFIIELSTPQGYDNQEYEEIFKKMLTSFKFL